VAWIERHVGITASGLLVMVFVVLAFALGKWLSSIALYLLAYGVVMVFIASWLLGRRKLAVVAGRTDLPSRVNQGQQVRVELSLEAQRRISTIVLEEELHDPLGQPVRVPIPLLSRGKEVLHPYTFSPKRRGVYNVGPLVAEWSDPFGLTKRREVPAEATEIIVHPSTELVHDRITQREWEDPPIRPPMSKPWPTGFEFYGMRDYVSGDDPRRIIWRKTAQYLDEQGRGRYLVKESEQGITDRVNLLLDSQRSLHSPGDPSATFEMAIRCVASVGAKHLNDGFAVSIDVNSRRVANRLRGRGNRILMLDELSKLQPEDVPFTQALERLLTDPGRQAHNVVITPHLEQKTAGRLRLLLNRGISILVVHLVSEDTDPISLHRAGVLGTNVVEVAAGQALAPVFARVHGVGRS
jgi:uncharacterized protein (DUF58 family)